MDGTLILTRAEIETLVPPAEALGQMRDAFRRHSTERTSRPLRLPVALPPPASPDSSAIVLMPGVISGVPAYTIKVHAKRPGRVPAIQGVIMLCDLETGATLAILESAYLTTVRTGLAGAIGADVLACPDARKVAIVGEGAQGNLQLEALQMVRTTSTVRVYDTTYDRAQVFAARNGPRLGIDIEPTDDLRGALNGADIVITATWANKPFLHPGMIAPGTHVTTLGADEPGKAELDADLLRSSLFCLRRSRSRDHHGSSARCGCWCRGDRLGTG